MRALVVLSPSIDQKIDADFKHYLKIDSLEIPLALIEIPDVEFDRSNPKMDNLVLVKKLGFSLNYRDLGVIERAWKNLKKLGVDNYIPVGSDFCGVVEKVGNKVTHCEKGDLVIADCFYPESKEGVRPGIPTNHGSQELEIIPALKLKRLPKNFAVEQAAVMSIGIQTSINMINRACIKEGSNVLVTSVTSNTSLFLLNFLRSKKCNVFGISYSGNNIDKVKKEFPFLKEVFTFNSDFHENLTFDAVLDPFSDTYLPYLLRLEKLSTGCYYVTCGIYSQSTYKNEVANQVKLSELLGEFIFKNISFIGNCLGPTESLEYGIQEISLEEKSKIVIDSIFTKKDDIGDFIDKTFNLDANRFGKVAYIY